MRSAVFNFASHETFVRDTLDAVPRLASIPIRVLITDHIAYGSPAYIIKSQDRHETV